MKEHTTRVWNDIKHKTMKPNDPKIELPVLRQQKRQCEEMGFYSRLRHRPGVPSCTNQSSNQLRSEEKERQVCPAQAL